MTPFSRIMEATLQGGGSMFDHVGLNVADYETSKRFFEQALAPLGYRVVMDFPEWGSAGFGTNDKPEFWVSARDPRGTGTHLAFHVSDRTTVDAFHAAALDAGGTDNGAPGLRPHYHETYYAAFVLDPDGNNVEAVCHRPE
jgi:catechol 2,3-dioxygenase-like lactoylglutathione lyase family enzyme